MCGWDVATATLCHDITMNLYFLAYLQKYNVLLYPIVYHEIGIDIREHHLTVMLLLSPITMMSSYVYHHMTQPLGQPYFHAIHQICSKIFFIS